MKTRIRSFALTLLVTVTLLALAILAASPAQAQGLDVYVTDYGGAGGVVEFDGTTGAFVKRFAQGTRGAGLAVDATGYFYYGNVTDHRVDLYDPQGNFVGVFATLRGEARGLTFGPDGNLYVSDYQRNAVEVFDGGTGEYLGDLVPPGSGGLSGSNGLAFGPDGSLYVASELNGEILQYDTGGSFVATVATGLAIPIGLAIGPDDSLYAVELAGAFVDKIDLSDFTIQRGFTRQEFRLCALTFSPDGTTIYVTGWEQNNVELYDATTGRFLGTFVTTRFGDPGYLADAAYILLAPPTGK